MKNQLNPVQVLQALQARESRSRRFTEGEPPIIINTWVAPRPI